jgi:1,4-dihydroxy-2-naphthoate polyprenyltransferase
MTAVQRIPAGKKARAVPGIPSAVTLIRYRFFLFAGLLPYLLGAAWAYAQLGLFDAVNFWIGFGGIVLAVVGVEAFNEYFDSLLGTDRVFDPTQRPSAKRVVFWVGIAAFSGALAVGVALTFRAGWPVLAFALLGGAAAVFYEAPPLRWSFHGLGEIVIGLAYGPGMMLGSLYLHAGGLSWRATLAALVPSLPITALAIANAIPDFHQDRLVGKRNLVVRLGRKRAVWLYLALAAASPLIATIGAASGIFPAACAAALLALVPLAAGARHALRAYRTPRTFFPAIRAMIASYLMVVALFATGLFFA